jgi:glyoxylase-like metal-dependent hydrolase (beta-lactamase superfamily II)
MTIQIDQLPLGMIQTNCYIVGETDTGDAIIIDPAAEGDRILAHVQERGYTIKEILVTHTHFDHIIAGHAVKAGTGAPFRLHKDGLPQLKSLPQQMAAFGFPMSDPPAEPDGFIEHGDIIEVGAMRLEARFTPGHSPGHLTFVMSEHKIAFVGDCIFRDGFGRTDLPGADAATLKKSIVEEILTLPDDFTLLSGHGPQTTVGREKSESAMLAQLLQFPG